MTKSVNVQPLVGRKPSDQIIVSFSVNSVESWRRFEKGTPDPVRRLECAARLKELGWRVRIRLDPVILDSGLRGYKMISERIASLRPERVTVGTLRQYPGLRRFSRDAPGKGLERSSDGRLRYPLSVRKYVYETIAGWLGFAPALCKETIELWDELGWERDGCNCTV